MKTRNQHRFCRYCQSELHMGFSWVRSGGFQTAGLPSSLPALAAPLKYQKLCAPGQGAACYTHYMNVVTGSYSAFNWNWQRWERECDWMALHGVNLVVAFNGQEYLWREVWRELGLTDYEIQTSFNGPASLSWSRTYEAAWENGGVWAANGTFEYSLDEGFLSGQHALQGRIVARQRELGIGSVLPAFSGKVPGQMKRLFPAANMSGDGSPGPAWIAGTDPLFANVST
jgi:alpha-N-acetylglucosaminidase